VAAGYRHIVFAAVLIAVVFGALGAGYVSTVRRAEARVGELRSLTDAQRGRLRKIDAHALELDNELHALRAQNDQIRKLIGAGERESRAVTLKAYTAERRETVVPRRRFFAAVAARVEQLRADSRRVRSDDNRLRRSALRVLNMHHLANLTRARVLAAIPSLNPAGRAGIASAFGWRAVPWPEFHHGVDLDADYGTDVRAGAAGTVVAAGYDGGCGIKVEIDHGNGYHTWYCHLSRSDVHPGEHVNKAEHIALVGSTGASTGPHLHYQIMHNGQAVDPAPYLSGVPENVVASLR